MENRNIENPAVALNPNYMQNIIDQNPEFSAEGKERFSRSMTKGLFKNIVNTFKSSGRNSGNFDELVNTALGLPENKRFDLIKSAVENDNFDFAVSLHNRGISVPPQVLLEAISAQNLEKVMKIITNKLFSYEHINLSFWCLLSKNMLDAAESLVIENPNLEDYILMKDIARKESVNQALENQTLRELAFEEALSAPYDPAAYELARSNFSLIKQSTFEIAIEHGMIKLITLLWSGDCESDVDSITKRKKTSPLYLYLLNLSSEENSNFNLKKILDPVEIVKKYIREKKYAYAKNLILWPKVKRSIKVFYELCSSKSISLLKIFLKRSPIKFTAEDFCKAFDGGNYEICSDMLQNFEGYLDIASKETQMKLIKLLEKGSDCLLAIQVIDRIRPKYWNIGLTRFLCETLNIAAKKSYEICYCSSPLLYCVLVAKCMIDISGYSRQYTERCLAIKNLYISIGCSIQASITDENSMKFNHTRKDKHGRTVLEIIAKYSLYELLSNDDLGLLVTKMWIGNENAVSILKSSSIYTSFIAPLGSEESLQFFRGMDPDKSYAFQYENFIRSCDATFSVFALSILFIIIIYQIMLYDLVSNNSVDNIAKEYSSRALFRVVEIWVLGITCEQVLLLIFLSKTKRKLSLNTWKFVDWSIAILIVLIAIGISGDDVGSTQLFHTDYTYLINGILHSLMLCLLCFKLIYIIQTSKTFGEFLNMLIKIIKEIFSFFIVYAGILVYCSTVFTLVFYTENNNTLQSYEYIHYSFRTLYMATIGPFTIDEFKTHNVLGPLMLASFLLLSHILLLNLLVGIVTNAYNKFETQVEAEYRKVVIRKYYNYSWNSKYGCLIMVPTPITPLALALSPLVLFTKNPEYWNEKISKLLYVFYAAIYWFEFSVASTIFYPLQYIKGFVTYGKTGRAVVEEEEIKIFEVQGGEKPEKVVKFSLAKSFFWTVYGPVVLLIAFWKDTARFFSIVYKKTAKEEEVYSFVNANFIKNVRLALKSISSKFISSDELYKCFSYYDRLTFGEPSVARSEDIIAFFDQFRNPLLNAIEVEKIMMVFIKVQGDLYDKEYFQRIKDYNMGKVIKALNSFQKKIGAMGILKKIKLNENRYDDEFNQRIKSLEEKCEIVSERAGKFIKRCKKSLEKISDS